MAYDLAFFSLAIGRIAFYILSFSRNFIVENNDNCNSLISKMILHNGTCQTHVLNLNFKFFFRKLVARAQPDV